MDPLFREYAYNSSYAFSENNVIAFIELEGLEKYPTNEEIETGVWDDNVQENREQNIAAGGVITGGPDASNFKDNSAYQGQERCNAVYHCGTQLNNYEDEGWYAKESYEKIFLDHLGGQVLPERFPLWDTFLGWRSIENSDGTKFTVSAYGYAYDSYITAFVVEDYGLLSPGSSFNLVKGSRLFKNAVSSYNDELTKVGRALTKHPRIIGETKNTLRLTLKTNAQLNKVASETLKNIMRNGTWTFEYSPTIKQYVIQTKMTMLDGTKAGARWTLLGDFVGFIQ